MLEKDGLLLDGSIWKLLGRTCDEEETRLVILGEKWKLIFI